MNKLTWLKRSVALLLALVMVVGLMPVIAFAAETGRESDTIFFATDRHEESSKLNSLLKALAYAPGLVVLGGDHVNNTNSGSLASITAEIQSVYPGVQTFYTYAAHDPNVSADSSNPYAYARTGEYYEGEDYYVYGVDQNDMQSASSAATASANFKSWAETVDSSKVIFVMCHMPIHSRRGDNAGGATWMSALNEVGQSHDIVYLWGHNHTGESSADTSVYFVGVGGSLTPQGGSTGTINFTYMNAGYIKNGYASMVVVNDDVVNVTRYSTSGSATASYTIERRVGQTHTWEVSEYVAATCETAGYRTTVCTDCGETRTSAIPATGHDYSELVQDTCTGSYTVYTCGVCGHSYSEQNATETTYDSVSTLTEGESYVIVASNYALTYGSSAGKTSVTVSNGSITSDVTDAMIWTYQNGMLYNEASGTYINYTGSSSKKTITFSSSGVSVSYSSNKLKLGSYYLYHSNNSGFSARSSGSTVTLYQVNEAFGGTGEHIYETVTVEPTCSVDGSVTYTCTLCGYSYSEVIEANGSHSYETVTVDATCGAEGSVTHTCTACGDSYTEVIPATGNHSYTAVTVDPTCEENGSVTYSCECGHSYTEVIAALGHNHEAVVTAPTCTEEGYTSYTCECGDSYVSDYVDALGHTYEITTIPATCTENGSVTYICACGDTYTEVIAALGHNHEAVVTAPTCTEAGFTTYICDCGDTYVADYVDALGHSYESVTIPATCTENGSVTYICACGDTYTEVIAALGHNHEAVVTAPTCTEGGYTTYICDCGDSYVTDEVAALGHDYESVTVAPTCTDKGYTGNTCTICGDTTVTDETAALGHSHEAVVTAPTCTTAGYTTYTCHCGDTYIADEIAALGHVNESVITEATCETEGYTTHTCTVCGEVTVDSVVPALGHALETVTVEATCTADGSVTTTCVRCGETNEEVIAALGHDHKAVITAPTCTEGGYTTYTCRCGDTYIADEVAALGHDYEAVVTVPTCETAGYTTYTCHCGDTYVADEVAALGHNHEAVVTAPTCETAGYTTYTCANCGDSYVADQTAALGHSYTTVESGSYLVYTCACGHSYSEKIASTYTQVSAIASGSNYVITFYSGSKYYALSHADNEISVVQVTVSNGEITSEVTEDLLWLYSGNVLSYEVSGTTYYLYSSAANSWWGSWFGGSLSISTSSSSTVSFSSNKLKVGNLYLRYSNGNVSLNRSATTTYCFEEN